MSDSNKVLDLDYSEARSLHRVVRAMHDGECPKCHRVYPAEAMRVTKQEHLPPESRIGWRCPGCGYKIKQKTGEAALKTFGILMDKNREIFDAWAKEFEASEGLKSVEDSKPQALELPPSGQRGMTHAITVTITGERAIGKTNLSLLLGKFLQEKGYQIYVSSRDGDLTGIINGDTEVLARPEIGPVVIVDGD